MVAVSACEASRIMPVTTPNGRMHHGKEKERKPLVEIAAMHDIPYSASTSIAFPVDLELKIKKAMQMKGSRFITVHAPCCLGAGFDGSITMDLAKAAVLSRLWFLFEIENGKLKLKFKMRRKRFYDTDEHWKKTD